MVPGKVLLLPGEPEGRVFVKNAGVVEVRATLTWRSPEEVPGRLLYRLPAETGLGVSPHEDDLGCEVEGRLSVFGEAGFEDTLGSALRHVTNIASVGEAVLEARALKISSPGVPDPGVVCGLARYLWELGVRVTFGRTRSPLCGADVALGIGRSNKELEAILSGSSGAWEAVDAEFG